MTRLSRAVAVAAAASLALTVATATAVPRTNAPLPTLDAVASAVAGKPVSVWCETRWADWIHVGDSIQDDWSFVNGFTVPSDPTIYLNPAICETLHAVLGREDVGLYHASLAIHVLVHEGVHQRGSSDEGVTDCTALSLFKDVAIRWFGFTATEDEAYTTTARRRVKVAPGRFATVRQTVVRHRQVPSRRLARAYDYAVRWHRSAPREYQGTC